jgi:MFS family permease
MLSGKLWRDREFLKLWGGQGISELGSQVSQLALPTVAILLLHATPFQVGLLAAFEFLAFPVLGLVAGVWVDRLRRRRIMIACDVGRMLALASVPVAFAFDALTIPQLYVVGLITGIGTVFLDVSYQSYLPSLILAHRPCRGQHQAPGHRLGGSDGGACAGRLADPVGGTGPCCRRRCHLLSGLGSIAGMDPPARAVPKTG